ncbi:prepilin peptidase [Gottschalkia purinilytica]|uniref:prepilin peptidase n=1 Tax=Gottschalkia purinilytica TaxID=1503 RepID=UPI00228636A3|nr:A24 family peptidase [Gottschalkia purinilytica]
MSGTLVGTGIFLAIAIISRGAIGGGDIKLIGVLGLYFSWEKIIVITILSFIVGGICSIVLLIFKIKEVKDFIPFGPFISLATLITVFYGEDIICVYMNLI